MNIMHNLGEIAEFGFVPYFVLGVIGVAIVLRRVFLLRRKSGAWTFLLFAFAAMFAWRLAAVLVSARYAMGLAVLTLPFAGLCLVEAYRVLAVRSRAAGRLSAVALLCLFGIAVVKFARPEKVGKEPVIAALGEIIAGDCREAGDTEAALLANTKERGRILFSAGISGRPVALSAESGDAAAVGSAVSEMSSKYAVCYVLWDGTGTDPSGGLVLVGRHAYRVERIYGGTPPESREPYVLFRVDSPGHAADDPAELAAAMHDPETILRNADFSAAGEPGAPPGHWVIDPQNRRGGDGWKWSYPEPDGFSATGMRFSGDGGASFRNSTPVPPGDYRLFCICDARAGTKLFFFLYAYDRRGEFLAAQNIGIAESRGGGVRMYSFAIREDDLPSGTVGFVTGMIAWGGDARLYKIDLKKTEAPAAEAIRAGLKDEPAGRTPPAADKQDGHEKK